MIGQNFNRRPRQGSRSAPLLRDLGRERQGSRSAPLLRDLGRERGFTLIELIIVCAMISILLGVMIPVYKMHILHANEVVLKQDLRHMRDAIDQYTQDKGKAPQDLNDLVSAGYLHAIPKDPFTRSTDTWQTVQEDVMESIDQTAPGISDVKSGSNQMSSEGTPYSSW